MKKSTKILSVLLALIMMFSMAMPSFAAVKSDTTTVAGLVSTESICTLVNWLLTNLNARKDKFVPTVLTFVDRYVDDIAAYIPNEKTVDTMSDEEKAKCVIDYCDALLAEKLGDTVPPKITGLAGALGITIDLKSVNGILKTLKSVDGLVKIDVLGLAYGDINDINFSALQKNGNAIQTSNGYFYVVKQLFQFLKDNSGVFQKVIRGQLDLGIIIEEFFDPDKDAALFKQPDGSDVSGGLNGSMKYLPTYIKNAVYDAIIDEPGMTAQKSWSIDEILGYGFNYLITGKTDMTQAESANLMKGTVYANLIKYAPAVYAKFAVEPLNTSFKDSLIDLGNKNAAFKAILNTEYTFTENDFNSLGITAQTGVLGGFNNMVYVVLGKILTPAAFKELALEKGTTAAKLNSNLTKLCRYILPKMGTFTGFDFSKFTAAAVKNMSLETMAVQVLKIFYPGWFHTKGDAAATAFVNSIDTMPEMLVAAAYLGFPEDHYGSRAGYKKIIMNAAGNAVNASLTEAQCIETALNILMDEAVYELDDAKETTLFTLSAAQVKKYKAAGWNWDDFADEIVDWALNMVKGVPAVTDKLSSERGKYDGYGAFNKLNAVVNEIINFSFMNNVSSLTPDGKVMSKFDFETLIMDGIIGNLCDFDIAGILGLFAVNTKSDNILNISFTTSAIGIIDKALEAVFNHTCTEASYTVAATCVSKGRTVKYCGTNGHINSITEIAATGNHTKNSGKVTKNATCTTKGKKQYNCTVCGKLMATEVINPLGHDYRSDGGFYKDKDGNVVQNKKCSRCGITRVDIITAAAKTPTTITSTTAKIAGNTVEGFYVGTTATELAKSFNEKGYIVVKGADGKELAANAPVKTGDVVTLVVSGKEIKRLEISVLGDIDSDGVVSSADARLALRQSVKLEALTGVYLLASDTDGKDGVTSSDARAILRQSVKLENFSRVF